MGVDEFGREIPASSSSSSRLEPLYVDTAISGGGSVGGSIVSGGGGGSNTLTSQFVSPRRRPDHHHHYNQPHSYTSYGGASTTSGNFRHNNNNNNYRDFHAQQQPSHLPPYSQLSSLPNQQQNKYGQHQTSMSKYSGPLSNTAEGNNKTGYGNNNFDQQPPSQRSLFSSSSSAVAPLNEHLHNNNNRRNNDFTSFPCQRYVTEPLLCEFLYTEQQKQKQEQQQQQQQVNIVKEELTEDKEGDAENEANNASIVKIENNGNIDEDRNKENNNSDALSMTYEAYNKRYCLNYIRIFFNKHLDDSWFRSIYSPLGRKQVLLQERDRAQREAGLFLQQVQNSLQEYQQQQQCNDSNSSDTNIVCSFVVNARLNGGIRAAPGGSHSLQSETMKHPSSHLSSLQFLHVYDIPPHVSEEQLILALAEVPNDAAAAAADDHVSPTAIKTENMRVYSTQPRMLRQPSRKQDSQFLYREAYVTCEDDPEQLLIIARELQKRHQQVRHHTTSAHHNKPTIVVPRKEEAGVHDEHDDVAWQLIVECSDPYLRTHVDHDGRGSAPPDGLAVTPRKSTVRIRAFNVASGKLPSESTNSQPPLQALSAALSNPARIPRDQQAALQIAESLDQVKKIDTAHCLQTVLHYLFGDIADRNLQDQQQVADMLDVTVAYLRRVHLFNFYHGCTDVKLTADSLQQQTICLRLRNPLEYLQQLEEHGTSNPPIERRVYTSSSNNNNSNNNDEQKGDNDEGDKHTSNDGNNDTTREGDKNNKNDDSNSALYDFDDDFSNDLMVQRLEESIAKALELCQQLIAQGNIMMDEETDAAASELEETVSQTKGTWLENHSLLDDDGRARCSFHFCHKLFKDAVFLRKHLLKKHGEYLQAQQANCHDPYMMKAWDQAEVRPVPDVLVDCGARFQNILAPVVGREPYVIDPEPALWKKVEAKLAAEEQARLERKRQHTQQRQQYQQQQQPYNQQQQQQQSGRNMDGSTLSSPPPRRFVDVDDVKVEKVSLDFAEVADVVAVPINKKKKKRKLL